LGTPKDTNFKDGFKRILPDNFDRYDVLYPNKFVNSSQSGSYEESSFVPFKTNYNKSGFSLRHNHPKTVFVTKPNMIGIGEDAKPDRYDPKETYKNDVTWIEYTVDSRKYFTDVKLSGDRPFLYLK
jgi:hypothetical protein